MKIKTTRTDYSKKAIREIDVKRMSAASVEFVKGSDTVKQPRVWFASRVS